jgi:hypothetical protein
MRLSTYEVNAGKLHDPGDGPEVDLEYIATFHTLAKARRTLRQHTSHDVAFIDVYPAEATASGCMHGTEPLYRITPDEALDDSEWQRVLNRQQNAMDLGDAATLWTTNLDPELALTIMRELATVPFDDDALMRALEGTIPAQVHPDDVTLTL